MGDLPGDFAHGAVAAGPVLVRRALALPVLGKAKEPDVAVLEAARDLKHRVSGIRRRRQEGSESLGVADQGHVRVDREGPLEAQLLDFPASRLKALAHHLRLLEAQAPIVPEVPPFVLADDAPQLVGDVNRVVRRPGVYHQHGIADGERLDAAAEDPALVSRHHKPEHRVFSLNGAGRGRPTSA